MTDPSWRAVSGPGQEVTIRPCGEPGPVLVRNARAVVDQEGTTHPVTRPVVAVCTCAKSQRLPWCDSTHKSIPR